MNIRVQHQNGDTETLTLVPPVEIVLGDQLNRLVSACGMEHYFDDAGYYDGWGRRFKPEENIQAEDIKRIWSDIDSSREIHPKGSDAA